MSYPLSVHRYSRKQPVPMSMKVESGASTATVLHTVKVKEEECSHRRSRSPASTPSPSSSGALASPNGPASSPATTTTAPIASVASTDHELKGKSKGSAERDKSKEETSDSSSPSLCAQQTIHQHQKHPNGSRSPGSQSPKILKVDREDDVRASGQATRRDETSALRAANVLAAHGKLKRLLGTLVQFAGDISQDTGDTVRTLILALLSDSMTAEEFHSALQETTNFPLRGFVLPYLKRALPSLQRDLNNAARANNQSCAQYLRSNESAILEAVGLCESVEPFAEHNNNNNNNNNTGNNGPQSQYGARGSLANQHVYYPTGGSHPSKRRASDAPYYENDSILEDGPVYGKRSNPWTHHQAQQQAADPSYCWYHPLHSSGGTVQGHGHGPSPLPPSLVQMTGFGHQLSQQSHQGHNQAQNGSSLDDEWKNIHVMLNCILGMVEKTKRALAILQRRGCPSPASAPLPGLLSAQNGSCSSNNPTSTNGAQVESSTGVDRDGSLKRLSGEIVAQTIRATEDRVAEVKRRAEEAVLEVKRAAVAEVQRAVAVAVAESRANERLRVHRLLDAPVPARAHSTLRPSAYMRVHPSSGHEAPPSRGTTPGNQTANPIASTTDDEKETHLASVTGANCWNCGRPALETCGGCGVARYCGSFCQHRDWEAGGHHATCSNSNSRDRRRSASQSPPRVAPTTVTSSPNDGEAVAPPLPAIAKGK